MTSEDPSSMGTTQETEREWYEVTLSVPWIVKGVDGPQDAINIAVAEVGDRTQEADHTRYVNLDIQTVGCVGQSCDATTDAVLLVADMALVGLRIEAVVRAKSPDHSEQVACRELGKHLGDMPLEPYGVSEADVE